MTAEKFGKGKNGYMIFLIRIANAIKKGEQTCGLNTQNGCLGAAIWVIQEINKHHAIIPLAEDHPDFHNPLPLNRIEYGPVFYVAGEVAVTDEFTCDICGDRHTLGSLPHSCETGDGE